MSPARFKTNRVDTLPRDANGVPCTTEDIFASDCGSSRNKSIKSFVDDQINFLEYEVYKYAARTSATFSRTKKFSSLAQAFEILLRIKLEELVHFASEFLQFLKTFTLRKVDYRGFSSCQEISSKISRRCTLKKLEVPSRRSAMISTPTNSERTESTFTT